MLERPVRRDKDPSLGSANLDQPLARGCAGILRDDRGDVAASLLEHLRAARTQVLVDLDLHLGTPFMPDQSPA
jgi:hypothetical protein